MMGKWGLDNRVDLWHVIAFSMWLRGLGSQSHTAGAISPLLLIHFITIWFVPGTGALSVNSCRKILDECVEYRQIKKSEKKNIM